MTGGGEPARISTSAKHSWRYGAIDNPAVNSLTRTKPKKTTQHAAQNIAASAVGLAVARVVCMVSRIDSVRGADVVEHGIESAGCHEEPGVTEGRPLWGQAGQMWRDLTAARYTAMVGGATDCASHDTNIISRNSEEGSSVDVHKDGNEWQKVQNMRWPVGYVRREFTAKR